MASDVDAFHGVWRAAQCRIERQAHDLSSSGPQLITMKNYDHLFDVYPDGWPAKGPPTELKDPKVIAAFDEVMAFLNRHVGPRLSR
jgi:hypothetical protein